MEATGPVINPEPSALLRLPFEIRRVVLEELLKDPLSTDRLPVFPAVKVTKLYPAILRTCKQLHDEGVSILYSHVLHFEIWHDKSVNTTGKNFSRYRCRPIYDGRCFEADTAAIKALIPEEKPHKDVPSSIISRVTQVNVQVNARRTYGSYELYGANEQLRIVASIVQEQPHWKTLTLRAYTSAGTSLHDAFEAVRGSQLEHPSIALFHQFRKLRGRGSLVCDGLDPVFAAELASVVTGDQPDDSLNVDQLCNELGALGKALQPSKLPHQPARNESGFAGVRYMQEIALLNFLMKDARSCADLGVVSDFLWTRRMYLEKVKDFLAAFHAESSDPVVTVEGDINWVRAELKRLTEQEFDVAPGAASTL